MAKTLKIYPVNGADEYYRNGSITNDGHAVAYAGRSGTSDYVWPVRFNLSAHASKRMTRLRFYAKRRDSGSNSVDSDRTISARTASNTSRPSDPDDFTLTSTSNAKSMPDGDTWVYWDISSGWGTLTDGNRYVVLQGNSSSYTVFHTNYSSVSSSNRPYIELVYDEGTVNYGYNGDWVECEVYYGYNGGWVRVAPRYGYDGDWVEIGGG